MSGVRRRVGIGDRILVGGRPNVVIGIAGPRVRMAVEDGTVSAATIAELAADPRFEFPAAAPPRGTRLGIGMEGLPAAVVEKAPWWRRTSPRWSTGCARTRLQEQGRGRSTTQSAPA